MDALFIIYFSPTPRGEGVQVLRNPHQELTMDSSVMLLTLHKADYFPRTLSHFR